MPSLWPPQNDTDDASVAKSLRRCSRFLLDDQDTGGFFVAILKKGVEGWQDPGPPPGRTGGPVRDGNAAAAPLRTLPDTLLREIVARHDLDPELAHARLCLAPPVDGGGGGGRPTVVVIPGALGAFGRDGCGGIVHKAGARVLACRATVDDVLTARLGKRTQRS